MTADITIVRACVRSGAGGSPTAVVDDQPAATDADRQAIPAIAGTSHAAFLSRELRGDGSRAVRFFTSQGELANCGHAIIAAQAVLLLRHGTEELRSRLHAGGRSFDAVAVRQRTGVEVWFDQGIVALRQPYGDERATIVTALGLSDRDVHPVADPAVASPGTPRLLLPVRDRTVLLSVAPRFDELASATQRWGLLGCFVYVPPSRGVAAAGRMFAPAIGVDEDITNANSVGCLAAHLRASTGVDAVEVEQGDALGHPGTVRATATAGPDGVRVRIGAVATAPGVASGSTPRSSRWHW